jgi:hypothetical protein
MITQQGHKYIPLVSPEWRPGQPVTVYADVGKLADNTRPGGVVRWEGTLALGGLPGAVRTGFERTAFVPAPNYQLLDVGDKPERTVQFAWAMILLAVAILGLTLVVWGIKLFRARATP